MAQFQFDSRQYEANRDFSAIPEGWYIAAVTRTEIKQTKAKGQDYFLELDFKIMDGLYRDSVLTDRFNIRNKSEAAQKIGCGQVKALCEAVNTIVINDTQELHGKPLKIRVKVEPATQEGYSASNSITAFKPLSYEPPHAGAAPAIPQAVGFPGAPAPAPVNTAPYTPPPAPQAPYAAPQAPQAPVQQFNPAQYAPQAPQAPAQAAPSAPAPVQPQPQAPFAAPAAAFAAPAPYEAPAPFAAPGATPFNPVAPAPQAAPQAFNPVQQPVQQPAPQAPIPQAPQGDMPSWLQAQQPQ